MAYDFTRQFDASESVNFHYISEKTMKSRPFEIFLLSLHLGFLLIFLFFKWTKYNSIPELFNNVRLWPISHEKRKINKYNALLILLTCNFIGMSCSRGTHQQFYAWYSFSFPFLLNACEPTFGPLSQMAI